MIRIVYTDASRCGYSQYFNEIRIGKRADKANLHLSLAHELAHACRDSSGQCKLFTSEWFNPASEVPVFLEELACWLEAFPLRSAPLTRTEKKFIKEYALGSYLPPSQEKVKEIIKRMKEQQ